MLQIGGAEKTGKLVLSSIKHVALRRCGVLLQKEVKKTLILPSAAVV
jgi:hypothetical protein